MEPSLQGRYEVRGNDHLERRAGARPQSAPGTIPGAGDRGRSQRDGGLGGGDGPAPEGSHPGGPRRAVPLREPGQREDQRRERRGGRDPERAEGIGAAPRGNFEREPPTAGTRSRREDLGDRTRALSGEE